MGSAGFSPGSGARDEPLRRQHLLRRARAVGRLDADHRRGDGHPQSRRRDREGAAEDQHPAHPPPSRPHPGPDVLRPLLPLRVPDHDLGPLLAGGLAGGADRALHLRPALPRRGSRAAVRRQLPRYAGDRVGDRPGEDPCRGRHPPRAHAGLSGHRRRHLADLHLGSRARARRRPRDPRARVDLWIRPRSRRRSADPRLPVHGQRVPRARRLGPLEAHRHPHLRAPGRGPAPDAVPPRPAALR